ncbi:sensory histidine kinase in two-component regulatory system with AtoC [Candidatus Moduliflexus flocculans]|uniref:histidine kinase n=1 Tax=Candidatus Moduliflexus flocculans TaxID=1499966 RepID=A0A081BSR5_9BACT|nr:sensory histidine kinase in two-component regulatory system with AtoC [Candidatus Moduliflexus flocculans]
MPSSKPQAEILALEAVTVDFGHLVGLQQIHLRINTGEIHAIIGDHGAGKSTLVKVISGVLPKTYGRIIFDGQVLEKHSAQLAIKLGIHTFYQAENLLPNMTAVENIFLRRELKKFLFFADDKAMREKTQAVLQELDIQINPNIPIAFLPIAQQHFIELAKIVCFPSKLLIIDEISTNFLPKDVEKLHYIISMLRQGGTTVLYVSRNVDEIFNFANRVTILHKGHLVETTDLSNVDKLQLVQLTYSSMYSREQLEKNNLELFYLHNFNRSIIHNLPIPILVTDSKGIVALMNRLFAKMSALQHADAIGKPVQEILELPDRQAVIPKQTIRNLEPERMHGVKLKHGDSPQEIDLYVIPCLDEDQAFIGTIYLIGQAESAGFEKHIPYHPPLEPQKTLAEVAHEINNPLGIMLNYLHLMKTGNTAEQLQMNAGIIEKEIKRIKRILRNLTEQKDIPTPPSLPSEKYAKIDDIIDDVALLLQPMMMNNQIHLNVYGRRNIGLQMEPDLLKQVLLNIMLNGIEAMPDGGELAVHLGNASIQEQRYISIAITDDGVGIPQEHLAKIFEPFFTTKDTTESRGLGLSLCQDIIFQEHGVIEVERREPRGTTFRVLLPDSE